MKEDKTLVCRECGTEFVFSASEQEFYEEKGFTNEPGRCPGCRQARKQRMGINNERPAREMFHATCAECGQDTEGNEVSYRIDLKDVVLLLENPVVEFGI